jgi:acetylornithine deacetylase/succinyl-diaminopimelate desuccinylase-like protein
VDEESGACSSIGVRYLLDRKLISGSGAIYVYPGTNVTIGHRGLLRLGIDVKGENVHTGSVEWNTKMKGANAVRLFYI